MSSASGFLLVDKPSGPSSHDVVDAFRSITGERRIGHCGTLDPLASGLLILCVGVATRLAEYLTGHDKTYEARVLLGVTTDTDDVTGTELSQSPVALDRARIERELGAFRGSFLQRPPAFSARRSGGKRAYALARQGKDVELAPTPVTIHALRLVDFDGSIASLELRCSAGTYVRSLARDLGAALGCGGTIAALRRTHAGSFSVAEATPLADWVSAPEQWRSRLVTPADGLRDLEALMLDASTIEDVFHGRVVPVGSCAATGPMRAIAPDGSLHAILRRIGNSRWLRPVKVFHELAGDDPTRA